MTVVCVHCVMSENKAAESTEILNWIFVLYEQVFIRLFFSIRSCDLHISQLAHWAFSICWHMWEFSETICDFRDTNYL